MSAPGIPENNMLFHDYQFKMMDTDEDAYNGWSYDWENADYPVPGKGWTTLFLMMKKAENPTREFELLLNRLNNIPRVAKKGKLSWTIEERSVFGRRNVQIMQKRVQVLEGFLTDSCDCMLLSKTERGAFLQSLLHDGIQRHGYSALLKHGAFQMDLGTYDDKEGLSTTAGGPITLKLLTVTGFSVNGRNAGTLVTRMMLIKEDLSQRDSTTTDLARCLISYGDGVLERAMGPTIKTIAIHKAYRGKELLPLLWKFVKEFFILAWRGDAELTHVKIQSPRPTNSIIEYRILEDRTRMPVTSKDFFFCYAGFSAQEQATAVPAMFQGIVPENDVAAFFLPLVNKREKQKRLKAPATDTASAFLSDKTTLWKENLGAVACDACGKISVEMLQCARCRCTHYCNEICQKNDWKNRHKAWCGKTREEVLKILVAKGLVQDAPTGSGESMRAVPCNSG